MSNLLLVAEKFQRRLVKKAGLYQHVEELVVEMLNEGYVDEDIFGMVEDAISRVRSGTSSSSPWASMSGDLTELPGPPTERYVEQP